MWVSIADPDGTMTVDQLARIRDSIAQINATFGTYGVSLIEVDADSADFAEVRISVDDTSACGTLEDGILGCTTVFGDITLIDGWNWYAGSDADEVGAQQFDFQTIVTHEIGHAVGAEHSADAQSVMYTSLTRGVARRGFTSQDLALLAEEGGGDEDSSLTAALRAAGVAGRGLGGGHPCPICGGVHAGGHGADESVNSSIILSSVRAPAEPFGEFGAGVYLSAGAIGDPMERGDIGHRVYERRRDSIHRLEESAVARSLLFNDSVDELGAEDTRGPAGHNVVVTPWETSVNQAVVRNVLSQHQVDDWLSAVVRRQAEPWKDPVSDSAVTELQVDSASSDAIDDEIDDILADSLRELLELGPTDS
jgi:hypothetical protein